MAVRGDEVADGIDSHVRETIEKMVAEIRSSIQDVREAVDQQLEAAMQSVQADLKGVSFRSYLQTTIRNLEEETAAPKVAPPPPPPDSSTLREAIQAIERGKSQVEILNALLDQSIKFGSRAVLMILKGDSFSGWKGVGFAAHGGNDEQVKRFTAAAASIAELNTVLRNEKVVSWNGTSISSKLGAAPTDRAVLIPMVIKDKVAAALYVDMIEGSTAPFDQSSIEVLVFVTALLIDTLPIRKKTPSPSLSGGATVAEPVSTPTPSTAPPPRPPAAPVARPAPPAPATTPARPVPQAPPPTPARPVPQAPPPAFPPSFKPPPPPPVRPEPAPMSFVPSPPAAAPAPPPPPPATPAATSRPPAGMGSAIDSDRPSTQYIPPPGLARGGALGGSQTEEGKKHDEARRFARLLVSEIKLYNESKVDQGRKNKDLYERMKEDIDRSRQMYDERIPEEVRKVSNYFYDELVRILADNDADALGL